MNIITVALVTLIGLTSSFVYANSDYQGLLYSSDNASNPKYSGAFGSGFNYHRPQAIYDPNTNKTFFTYSKNNGSSASSGMSYMVSCYNHNTKSLCSEGPVQFATRHIADGHDNPAILIDESGYVWLYISARSAFCHETSPNVSNTNLPPIGKPQTRCSEAYKSTAPGNISNFNQEFNDKNFAYAQPWLTDKGKVLIYTRYASLVSSIDRGSVRELWIQKSNGQSYRLVQGGHYAVSFAKDNQIHIIYSSLISPAGGRYSEADMRTNLYYIYSEDSGDTWKTSSCKTNTVSCITFSGTPKSIFQPNTSPSNAQLDDLSANNPNARIIDVASINANDTRYNIFVQDIRPSISYERTGNVYILYTQVRSDSSGAPLRTPDASAERKVIAGLLQNSAWRYWRVDNISSRMITHNYSNGFIEANGSVLMPYTTYYGSINTDRAGGEVVRYEYKAPHYNYYTNTPVHHSGGRYNNSIRDVMFKTTESAKDFSFFWGDAPIFNGKNYSGTSDLYYSTSSLQVTKMQ